MTWREQHHAEELSIFDPADTATPPPRSDPGLYPCRAVGPYQTLFYKPYKCTRPAGHEGNHQRATRRDGPTHEWTADGAKVWPR